MTSYEFERSLVYLAEVVIKTFGRDFGYEIQEPKQEPKEPLIKDKKIRKAVRAWAEANELDRLYLANNGYEIYGGADDTVMQFVGEPLPHDNKDKTYTIEELCGEEEK